MKKVTVYAFFGISLALLFIRQDVDARGGHGGGGHENSGRGGSIGAVSRSPSLNDGAQKSAFMNNSDASRNGAVHRDQGNMTPTAMEVRSQLQTRVLASNALKDGLDNVPRNSMFNDNFWNQHGRPGYYNNGYGRDWYRPASWAALSGWLGYDAAVAEPYYYNEGTNYPVQAVDPSYQAQQPALATTPVSTPATTSNQQNGEWMPLGVFALTSSDGSTTPNMYMQLALNKSGIIQGTFYNSTISMTFPIIGAVDPAEKIARWKIEERDSAPVATTGLYNLTQAQTALEIRFPTSGVTQNWLMTRLQDS